MSPNGGTEYLTDTNVARSHLYLQDPGYVAVGVAGRYLIPASFWNEISLDAGNPVAHLLFEGCAPGKGQLVLTVNKPNGTEIAEGGGVWLEFKEVTQLYGRAVVTVDTTGAISNWTSAVAEEYPVPANLNKDKEDKDIIVLVHGINVSPNDWNVEAETVFKRLYWAGYHGKLAAVKWPCEIFDWSLLSTRTSVFNQSELKAYKSSTALAAYLTQLHASFPGYRLHLLAHSQGNAVVSEAIRQSGVTFDTYILTQGAMPDSSYDFEAPTDATLPTWEFVPGYQTPIWKPMGYLGIYTNFTGRIVNLYNPLDPVLDWWMTDQGAGKPNGYTEHLLELIPISTYYSYDGTNSFYRTALGFVSYMVTDPQESRAMISRSLTDPIGRSGPESSHGVIQSALDLHEHFHFGDASFDDHSAQWAWPIQTSWGYYDEILGACLIPTIQR